MATPYSDKSVQIDQAEHISPAKTGDNIEAKRVANYVFNTATSLWERDTGTQASFNIDPNNSTTAALTAGATFNGTAVTLTNYSTIVIKLYGTASTAQGTLYFEFSDDSTNWDVSVPILVDDPTYFIPFPLKPVGKYFRIRYMNDGGVAAGGTGTPTTQTAFRLTTYLSTEITEPLGRTLAQTVKDNQPVILGRNVTMGKSTDGTYQNFRADGIVASNSSTTPLTANSTYTGSWFDAQGYAGWALVINADQSSTTSGVVIEFSDTSAGTVIRDQETNTYGTSDIGFGLRESGPIVARYIRVRYTNTSSNQTIFFLQLSLTVTPVQNPLLSLTSQMADGDIAVESRSVLAAKNAASGLYGNIPSGDLGGLKVDIDALTGTTQMNQTAVTGSAAQFAASPLTGRRSIMFVAPTSNTKIVAVGKSSGITVTGSSVPLGPGASLVLDIDDTDNTWYAIAESGTQRIAWVEIS